MSAANGAWSSGDHAVYREVLHGRVWTARPVTVIEATAERVALYLAHGTVWQRFRPVEPGAAPLDCKANRSPWRLGQAVWEFGGTVLLASAAEAHAVHVMWDQAWAFGGWYVNLQEPLRRTEAGVGRMRSICARRRRWASFRPRCAGPFAPRHSG